MNHQAKQATTTLSTITHVGKDGSIVQVSAHTMQQAYKKLLKKRRVHFDKICN